MKVDIASVDLSALFPKGPPSKACNLTEIEPYNQSDMYLHHCNMLIDFANQKDYQKAS